MGSSKFLQPYYPTLKELYEAMSTCDRCPLCKKRSKVVIDDGNPSARVMYVGEYPGKKENELGRPLVGPSGKTFDFHLKTLGVSRSEVYVTNAIKCYHPETYTITKTELDACRYWLMNAIYLVDPYIVVAMGSLAVRALTQRSVQVTHYYGYIDLCRVPGKHVDYLQPIGIIANPAFILRENDYRENSSGHYQLWAMQQYHQYADYLDFIYNGSAIPVRSGRISPPRLHRLIPDTSDDVTIIDAHNTSLEDVIK